MYVGQNGRFIHFVVVSVVYFTENTSFKIEKNLTVVFFESIPHVRQDGKDAIVQKLWEEMFWIGCC